MSRLSQPFSSPENQLLVESARYEWLELRAFSSRTSFVLSVKMQSTLLLRKRIICPNMTKNFG